MRIVVRAIGGALGGTFGGAALAALLLAGAPAIARRPPDLRTLLTQRDRDRLKNWRTDWMEALANARARGAATQVEAEGVLLQPDAALPTPAVPDGEYRCRLVKVGAQTADIPAFLAFPPAPCRIANGQLTTLAGPQRPDGEIFPYDGAHMLFLGALAIGDEQGNPRYGHDTQRNLVGLVDRIGPARWRIALPKPAWQSRLDVLELVLAAG